MPVNPRSHRKQILLFLLAVLLPSLVLIVITIRLISQEQELAQKRILDEHRRLAREIGQHLLVRLEKIKLQETNAAVNWILHEARPEYINPEVVLVCLIEEQKLTFPWEIIQTKRASQQTKENTNFSHIIQRGEKEEFENKNLTRAAQFYRKALTTAKEPANKGFAQLLLARAFQKANQSQESLGHYQEILALPSGITDEYGIPLAFYAAGRLLDAGESLSEVANRIQSELESKRWLSPSESYMLRGTVEKLINFSPGGSFQDTAEDFQQKINEYIAKLEQALTLQNDFQSLGLEENQNREAQRDEPIWTVYGAEPWLISYTPPLSGSQPLLIAVDVQEILASLRAEGNNSKVFPSEFQFVTDTTSEGESLGPNFPRLKIAFGPSIETALKKQWSFRQSFYLFALILILSVTLFTAYLLWRDVRREVRTAEMRSQFVSSVSHELKTPLTSIRMFAETLRSRGSKDKKMQQEYLDTIVNESQRLTRLLNNVLDFSKIEQGKRIYQRVPTSLYEIIQATARAMEYPLSQLGFKLHIKTEKGLPDIMLDRDAVEQALLNLLSNAMKYSGDSRDINLRLERKGDFALIQVIDRGIGIDAKEQKQIFNKFYRVPSQENERLPGTGLGLTIVSYIIKAHGGRMEVKNSPGGGSIFSIYLPLETRE
ncbi:MAG: ATP-binding protein [Candidatus Aminicenantaceae bacterium]